jgi:UDP-sugar transporter A1/2/3
MMRSVDEERRDGGFDIEKDVDLVDTKKAEPPPSDLVREPLFTRTNVFLFVMHIGMWTTWTLLIKSAKDETGAYPFDIVTVVLMMELYKIILTMSFHCYMAGTTDVVGQAQAIAGEWRAGIWFAVPAFIYTLYNWLLYLNLVYFDPVSYRVLINMRILFSGLLVTFCFGKRLGTVKWLALVLLAFGCAVNQIGDNFELKTDFFYLCTITIQALASSGAGAFNEWLLKKDIKMGINQKNLYLYFFSLCFNLTLILLNRPHILFSTTLFFAGWSRLTVVLVVLGAFCGFTTALFLRYLNIILKEYAHGGEMFATAFASRLLFHVPLSAVTFVSIFITAASVIMYGTAKEPERPGGDGSGRR